MYDFLSTSFAILYCLEIIWSGPMLKEPVRDISGMVCTSIEVPQILNGIQDIEPLSPTVVINEILFDHYPTVALPDCEYIEIFNPSRDTLNTNQFVLNGIPMPESYIFPDEYLIICHKNNISQFESEIKLVGMDSWDILNNEGQTIILTNRQSIILDQVTYTSDWIEDKEKKEGGWSLELTNPYASCRWKKYWKVSEDISGGTPGRENSVFNQDPDLEKPLLNNIRIIDSNSISITFSEPLNTSNTNPYEYYQFEPSLDITGIEEPPQYPGAFILHTQKIKAGLIYKLFISGLSDCSGNLISDTTLILGIGKRPEFNDLLITELMIDETPSVGLPECEYIEILNVSNSIITLDEITIIADEDYFVFQGYQLLPDNYYLLVHEKNASLFQDLENIIPMMRFPRLNNSGETLVLVHSDKGLIFSMAYDIRWYNDLEKSVGGYSIEMIDLKNPCGERNNWRASENPNGGTPGKENSVMESNPDLTGPAIQNSFCRDSVHIEIFFNEKIHPASMDQMVVQINDADLEFSLQYDSILLRKVEISLSTPLSDNTKYSLELQNIKDCVGNNLQDFYQTFSLPEKAGYQEIIFNEILMNEKPGGVPWVELYNKSDKYIDLTGWSILVTHSDGTINRSIIQNTYIISPFEFLVLSNDAEKLIADFPFANKTALLELPNKIDLKNENASISLINSGSNEIDYLTPVILSHNILLKKTEGVSFERVSSLIPTNEPENWYSASSESGYGTPGYRNSQDINHSKSGVSLTITPEIFSPDNDGYDDIVTVKYEVDGPGYLANIYIYDLRGKRIKTINAGTIIGTSGQVYWDGYYDNGATAGSGYYIIVFELYNPNGAYKIIKRKLAIGQKM